jgi:nucleoside-diphosphate-sugar epimerase
MQRKGYLVKVLVTGATGFLGNHIVPELLLRGHAITAVARDENKARKLEWFNNVAFVAHDIHHGAKSLLKRIENPDAVIHLAWTGLPNYDALFHFEKNLPGHYRFLKGLIKSGIRHFLITGTCFEYGMQCGPLTEATPTTPVVSYAVAKDMLHKLLCLLQPRYPFVLQWARLFYIYGRGQHPHSLLAQLDHALDAKEPEFNMSRGEQLRDYLPVTDVASTLGALIEKPECTGPINICSGIPISVRTLVERHLVARGAHIKLNIGSIPYAAFEPIAFWGDREKLSNYLAT